MVYYTDGTDSCRVEEAIKEQKGVQNYKVLSRTRMECLSMGASANDDVNALRFLNLETSDENILAVSKLQTVREKDRCDFAVTDIDKLIEGGQSPCTTGPETIDIGLLCEGEGGHVLPAVNLDEFAAGTEDTATHGSEMFAATEMLSCDSTNCLGDGALGTGGVLDGERLTIGGELIDGGGSSGYDLVGKDDMDGLLLDAPVTETKEVAEETGKVDEVSSGRTNEEGREERQIVNPEVQDVSRLMSYICSQAVLKGKEGCSTVNMVGSDMSSEELRKSCDEFDVCEMLRLYSMERSVENIVKFETLFTHGWKFESEQHDNGGSNNGTSGETVCGVGGGEDCTVDKSAVTHVEGEDELLPGDNLLLVRECESKEICGDVFDVVGSEGCEGRMDAMVGIGGGMKEGCDNDVLLYSGEGGGMGGNWGMVAPWWAMRGAPVEMTAATGTQCGKRGRERGSTGSCQVSDEELLRRRPKKKRRAAKFDKPVPSRFCHVCSRTPKNVRLAVCTRIQQGTCRKVICEKCFAKYGYGRFESALRMDSQWLCPHCQGCCPDRAQCRTYQRINDRLRVSRLRQETARAASTTGTRTDAPRAALQL